MTCCMHSDGVWHAAKSSSLSSLSPGLRRGSVCQDDQKACYHSQSHYQNLLAALRVTWRAVTAQRPFHLLTFTLPLPCFSQILSTEQKNQETKSNNIVSSQFMKRVRFFLEHKNAPPLWLTWDKMEAKPDPLYSEGTSRASEEHRLRLPHKRCRFTTQRACIHMGLSILLQELEPSENLIDSLQRWAYELAQPPTVSHVCFRSVYHDTITYFIFFYHLRTQVS